MAIKWSPEKVNEAFEPYFNTMQKQPQTTPVNRNTALSQMLGNVRGIRASQQPVEAEQEEITQ